MCTRWLIILTGGLLVGFLAAPQPGRAQERTLPSPLSNVVLSGYGTTTYRAGLDDDFTNNFTASLAPVLLYSMGNDVLFETELEFGLSGEQTTTALEYAQIDYLGFERVQLIAGKFLLPFGLFSERLHPTWINKLPTAPLLYGHAHGGVAEGALLPMLSDAGVMGRLKQPLGAAWAFDLSLWVSQGPRLIAEEAGDDHDDGAAHKTYTTAAPLDEDHNGETGQDDAHFDGVPRVGFGVAFGDNNKNKMIGGRVGLVRGPGFEAYLSGFHAMYDPDNFLDFAGGDLAVEFRRGPLDLRGEGMLLWQEFAHEDDYETLRRGGYYVQAARRFGAFEPVIRWSHLPEGAVDGITAAPERQDLTFGLTYWIEASVPVKLAYAWDPDGTDGLLVQWAYGF